MEIKELYKFWKTESCFDFWFNVYKQFSEYFELLNKIPINSEKNGK